MPVFGPNPDGDATSASYHLSPQSYGRYPTPKDKGASVEGDERTRSGRRRADNVCRKHSARRLSLLLIASTTLAAFTWASSSQATVVTVGTPLPIHLAENVSLGCSETDGCVVTNPDAPKGTGDVSPIDGVILRWRVYGATVPTDGYPDPRYRLRVLSRQGYRYLGAGTSATVGPVNSERAVFTFPTHLPIRAGQIIALELANRDAGLNFGFSPEANPVFIEPAMRDGESASPSTAWGDTFIFPFNADVLPPPMVSGISPSGSSFARTATVVISGQNFAEVQSVAFGSTQVGFTVNSDSQLTATVPAGPRLAAVPVKVVTAAGSAEAPETYTYEACVVPKLKGKMLGAARKALLRRKCRLAAVSRRRHAQAKFGRVRRQSPRAGKVLPLGGRVKVTLGLESDNPERERRDSNPRPPA